MSQEKRHPPGEASAFIAKIPDPQLHLRIIYIFQRVPPFQHFVFSASAHSQKGSACRSFADQRREPCFFFVGGFREGAKPSWTDWRARQSSLSPSPERSHPYIVEWSSQGKLHENIIGNSSSNLRIRAQNRRKCRLFLVRQLEKFRYFLLPGQRSNLLLLLLLLPLLLPPPRHSLCLRRHGAICGDRFR